MKLIGTAACNRYFVSDSFMANLEFAVLLNISNIIEVLCFEDLLERKPEIVGSNSKSDTLSELIWQE
jgi:hypothetical protein